jgi:hypothetical protein
MPAARRFDIAHLVADRDRLRRRDTGPPHDRFEFRGLAEQRSAAGVMREQRCMIAELAPRIALAVRSHQRQRQPGLMQSLQHRRRAGKQRQRIDLLALQRAHAARDRGQFPQRHLEPAHDLARAFMPQRLDLVVGYLAETVFARDVVHDREKPRKAVDQRAVEVEDHE